MSAASTSISMTCAAGEPITGRPEIRDWRCSASRGCLRHSDWSIQGKSLLGNGTGRPALHDFSINGAIPDVAPIVDAVPLDALDQPVRLGLRCADIRAQPDRAQNPSAVGEDVARFEAGTGVKDLSGQRRRTFEALDRIPLAYGVRVARCGHDHTEGGALVPLCLDRLQA